MWTWVVRMAIGACAVFSIARAVPLAAEPLTLAIAIERTLASNPDLAVYAPRLRAQQARTAAAALRPPIELRTEVQDALGTGRASSFDSAETTFAVSHVVELGGKRGLRAAAAGSGSDVIAAQRAAAELDVLTEVARRFIHVASDQAKLGLTQRAVTLADETVAATATRVDAARAPEVELRRARVRKARAEVEHEHAEHELASSRRRLAALWGAPDLEFDAVETDLYALPQLDTFERLLARLEDNPDFLVFASTARLRDAELRVAEAQARTNLTVNAGVRLLHDTNDEAFVFGVTLPLGAGSRARSGIAAAQAERDETAAQRHAHRVRAEAQLFELYQELRHSLTEVEVLRSTVLPEMEAAVEATRYAFERGRYGYLEWVDAQSELADVERALIDAATNAHLYRAEIERLTGQPLTADE